MGVVMRDVGVVMRGLDVAVSELAVLYRVQSTSMRPTGVNSFPL